MDKCTDGYCFVCGHHVSSVNQKKYYCDECEMDLEDYEVRTLQEVLYLRVKYDAAARNELEAE